MPKFASLVCYSRSLRQIDRLNQFLRESTQSKGDTNSPPIPHDDRPADEVPLHQAGNQIQNRKNKNIF